MIGYVSMNIVFDLFDPGLEPIVRFDEEYHFLSNFYMNPSIVYEIDSLIYRTTEAAYQAAKTDSFTMKKYFASISDQPGKCKREGGKLKLSPFWQTEKLNVMTMLVDMKFNFKETSVMLKSTGRRELIEGNLWGDTFWGECPLGTGQNHLGIILMEKRKYG